MISHKISNYKATQLVSISTSRTKVVSFNVRNSQEVAGSFRLWYDKFVRDSALYRAMGEITHENMKWSTLDNHVYFFVQNET